MTGMTMIRPGVAGDLPAVLARERAAPTAPHWSEREYAAILEGSGGRCLFVAETAGHGVAGFAVGAVAAGDGELESVVVAAGLQGRGIGRALCIAVLGWCREQGAAEVRLEVRAGSAGAIGLYGSLGFLPVGRRPVYYGDPVEDALLMRWRTAGL